MVDSNIYFATGNQGKFREAQLIIPALQQLNIDLTEVQEIDPQVVIAHKLKEAQKHFSGSIIVEDTSLYLSALQGLPGPLIKWFLKTIGNEGLVKIATQFGDLRAEAKTIVGLAIGTADPVFFEGKITGKIVNPRGNNGFGWDSIFQPDGFKHTFAELGPEQKSGMSMRKLAFEKVSTYLSTLP